MTIKEALVGKELHGFQFNEDGTEIMFFCGNEQAKVILRTEGDCCSSTWIESIDDPKALCGRVLDVEDIEMPNQIQKATPLCPYPDSVSFYGLKITTEKGRAILDYRNNSNGYYGGSLYLVE